MNEIMSIDTVYNGHKFRSRLEARYAIFMQSMNIEWVYELEGYKLPSGWYLPDFYLPDFEFNGSFAEVKFKFNEDEIKLCKELCELTKKPVLMLEGIPSVKMYSIFYFEETKNEVSLVRGMISPDERRYGQRMYVWPEFAKGDYEYLSEEGVKYWEGYYNHAIDKANMARFEFADKIIR